MKFHVGTQRLEPKAPRALQVMHRCRVCNDGTLVTLPQTGKGECSKCHAAYETELVVEVRIYHVRPYNPMDPGV